MHPISVSTSTYSVNKGMLSTIYTTMIYYPNKIYNVIETISSILLIGPKILCAKFSIQMSEVDAHMEVGNDYPLKGLKLCIECHFN